MSSLRRPWRSRTLGIVLATTAFATAATAGLPSENQCPTYSGLSGVGPAEDAVPTRVLEHLARGVAGDVPETPGPGDPVFVRVRHDVIASNADARRAAVAAAEGQGLRGIDLGEVLVGEARGQARSLVDRARAQRGAGPVCLVAGGETTVTLTGGGRGGRSQELALAVATLLAEGGDHDIAVLAAGTDGTDGPTDAAGAYLDSGTLERGSAEGVDAKAALAANGSYDFFAQEGGLVITGPTRTNVMDLVLIEVSAESPR